MASPKIVQLADDFWNIRGSFRIGHVVDIGTHISLVRLKDGTFVMLDAYTLDRRSCKAVSSITGGGQDLRAIINLHPFHTVHVERAHAQFPEARLYGTARHVERLPKLPWETQRSEDAELHELFSADLEFSVPGGVDFISSNPNIHFSSVLAWHPSSGTIHVDDTFIYARLPGPLGHVGLPDFLGFHPTLARALEKRAGAAAAFRDWATTLAASWGEARNLCAAHNGILEAGSKSIGERMQQSLRRVERTLACHERRYG